MPDREPPGATPDDAFAVVGLGASAGGLQALQGLLEGLPARTGMAYVVILHLSPDRESRVAELLQKRTEMPVTEVTQRVLLRPDHVYVIPPDRNLSSVDDHLDLSPRPPAGWNRAPIDHFFRTLADTHGPAAVGIVLSGTGTDGAQGLRRIKERGGITLVQSPEEAEHDGMPRSAIRTGAVDMVRPVAQIGPHLVRVARLPVGAGGRKAETDPLHVGDEPVQVLFRELKRRFGHDFNHYKRATVLRRISRRMQLAGAESPDAYLRLTREHPVELEALDRDLLIVVTSFFRDPEAFDALETVVLPGLFEGKGPDDTIRAWVAGCATGEEAYTLAILLSEVVRRSDDAPEIKIFATDVNEHAFNLAREGLYPEGITADVSDERLARNFDREKGGFRVKKHLRDAVLFASHDLLRDPPFSRLDLVICRNVLIYLKRDAQRRVLELFHYALDSDGHLFLGTSESVDPSGELFGAVDERHKIFRSRRAPRDRPPLLLPPLDRTARPGPPEGTPGPYWAKPFTAGALHQELVELYAPPSVLVDSSFDLVHLSKRAGRYLRPPGGEPSTALLDMAEGDLRVELRALLYQAFRRGAAARGRAVVVEVGGRSVPVRPSVRPWLTEGVPPRHALVVFEEVGERSEELPPRGVEHATDDGLEREDEVRRLRDQLRSTIEEHDETIQRFQAAYEELQSINEEQKATSEELETSKEELQSVNEELRTVNQEFRAKIEELAELNADLKNLINSTDIATIFLDRDLAVRRFTPQVTGLFNFVSGDIGRRVGDVTHRLEYPALVSDARSVLDSLERVEREIGTDDGRWFTVRMAPYRSLDDRIDGVVIAFFESSDRKRADVEREALLADAQRANVAKSSFLGVLSHEFRTPLSGIIGYTDILAEGLVGEVNEKQRHHLGRIKLGANQLVGMVEEILEYARLEEGKASLQVLPLDLGQLAREVVDLVTPLAEHKGLEVRLDLHPDLPTLRTDAGKLRQILLNLLGNAVKFTERGRIELRVLPEDAHVVIEVEDTGIGIAPEHRERIFERFWQVEGGTARTRGGTGLGLTVVRDLARLLGGGVSVAGEPGRGTTFTVSLPLAPPQA